MISKSATTIYFWGCWNDSKGHYLWRPTPTRYEQVRHNNLVPWQEIDGALTPGNRAKSLYAVQDNYVESCEQIEGAASLHHRDGWTALAWWDRSVDTRYGSNAALFAHGTHDFVAMMVLGRQHFPGVMARFRYEIVVVTR